MKRISGLLLSRKDLAEKIRKNRIITKQDIIEKGIFSMDEYRRSALVLFNDELNNELLIIKSRLTKIGIVK